ncbi:AraC family transcriptional regulator [Paenibacillus sp. P96]|uniref:AraC family transcriptional regulator n=1 Tax=Paenibacillus zeirhizosphaerae TaxID=2987519 RepID=A0ABT9FPP1_9BACL|nr:AraC family transcriptional regulator [Paenibacillus sp. P96]MDP4096688.1 AraC family transcriptional regulator [Paenibacillus sp. P96]
MHQPTSAFPISAYQQELAQLIQRHAPSEGIHVSAVAGLHFRRISHETEPAHTANVPSLYVIAQGAKAVTFGDETYSCDVLDCLVTSVHLPVSGRITQASPGFPYLSVQLEFSLDMIMDIIKASQQKWDGKTGPGFLVSSSTPSLLDAVIRLIKLLDTPDDIPFLAPLILHEILYRVMQSEQGSIIRQFALIGSQAQRITKAVHLISRDYSKPFLIEELAQEVNMSPSALHKQFKKVTAMSPLQFQKVIRLQAARRIMLTEDLEAAEAGFRVGYESPSQFSREYARLFGRPPMSDVKHLRASMNTPEA